MPSPVGHALGGLIVGLVTGDRQPGTGSREPATGNRQTATGNREPGTWNLEPGTWNLEPGPGTWNPEPGTWNLKPATGRWLTLLVPAVAATLPDLDFLWGRHNMETHSLGAAALAGLVVMVGTGGRNPRLALAVALAWASHVLFDWLGSDDTPPLGVMALWPVTSDFYFAHAYVFEAISRRTWLPNFWSHNLRAVAWELAMLGPLAGLAWWRASTRRR